MLYWLIPDSSAQGSFWPRLLLYLRLQVPPPNPMAEFSLQGGCPSQIPLDNNPLGSCTILELPMSIKNKSDN